LTNDSFSITFYVRPATPLWQKLDNEKNGMKMKRLNGQQLALLTQAFGKKLFPIPKTGQCLASGRDMENFNDFACFIYFDLKYYEELVSSINNHLNKGSFAQSNAESEWIDLKLAIEGADTVSNIDFSRLKVHSSSEGY